MHAHGYLLSLQRSAPTKDGIDATRPPAENNSVALTQPIISTGKPIRAEFVDMDETTRCAEVAAVRDYLKVAMAPVVSGMQRKPADYIESKDVNLATGAPLDHRLTEAEKLSEIGMSSSQTIDGRDIATVCLRCSAQSISHHRQHTPGFDETDADQLMEVVVRGRDVRTLACTSCGDNMHPAIDVPSQCYNCDVLVFC